MNPGASSRAKRAIVIDDNPVNLKITVALIRKAGFLVDMAETAEAALDRLAEDRPDLIVTDLQLPGMDGLDFTRAVKRNPAWATIPVILLTADDSKELADSARQSGCECLIRKPVDTRLFPGMIAAFLGTPHAADPTTSLDDLNIDELRKEFLVSGARECRSILSEFFASRQFVPTVDYASIHKALHRWAGVGGTLGFPEITLQARALEALIANPDPGKKDDLREKLIELLGQFTREPTPHQTAPAPPKETRVVAESRSAVRPVVLVADDDATIRAVIKLSLVAAGFECRLAENGAMTCTMARNDPPDAIVLDVNMPRMDGFEVLYALRNFWSTRHVPVILLSARGQETDIIQAAQLGAAEYMTKPFEINDLLARLARVLTPREP